MVAGFGGKWRSLDRSHFSTVFNTIEERDRLLRRLDRLGVRPGPVPPAMSE